MSITHKPFLGFAAASLAFLAGAAAASEIEDIRVGQHKGYVRVVLDLSGPVTFATDGHDTLKISGLTAGNTVVNADPKQAPLQKVIITPEGEGASLRFDASAELGVEAFVLTPDTYGGHRLVVDLKPLPGGNHGAPVEAGSHAAPDVHAAQPPDTHAADMGHGAEEHAVDAHAAATEHQTAKNNDTPHEPAPEAAHEPAHAAADEHTAPPKQEAAHNGAAPPPPAHAAETEPAPVQTPANKPAPAAKGTTAAIDTMTGVNATPLSQAAVAAERALDAGRTAEACKLAENAQAHEPNDLRATVVLGWCRLDQGYTEAAKREFDKVVLSDPSFNRARIGLAEAERRLGNLDAARLHLETVLQNSPPPEEAERVALGLEALKQQTRTGGRQASAPQAPSPVFGVAADPAPRAAYTPPPAAHSPGGKAPAVGGH